MAWCITKWSNLGQKEKRSHSQIAIIHDSCSVHKGKCICLMALPSILASDVCPFEVVRWISSVLSIDFPLCIFCETLLDNIAGVQRKMVRSDINLITIRYAVKLDPETLIHYTFDEHKPYYRSLVTKLAELLDCRSISLVG